MQGQENATGNRMNSNGTQEMNNVRPMRPRSAGGMTPQATFGQEANGKPFVQNPNGPIPMNQSNNPNAPIPMNPNMRPMPGAMQNGNGNATNGPVRNNVMNTPKNDSDRGAVVNKPIGAMTPDQGVLKQVGGTEVKQTGGAKSIDMSSSNENIQKLIAILNEAKRTNASDIHLAPNCPSMLRIDGDLVPMQNMDFAPYEVEELLKQMLTDKQMKELEDMGELDFAYSLPGFSRIRLNVFRQRGTYAMALRILNSEIPDPKKLGLPQSVIDLTKKKRGLVLVTGATGSGKSTTLASLIGLIAKNYAKTIITLEDPIEYLHHHGKSVVMQREIGYDTMSYANGLRAALREDPDVILVGEMRDLETIQTAITAAETGHLVFSTLHTNSAADTIDRVIDVFPPHQQQQVRIQFAGVLIGVVAQQLLPLNGKHGRVGAFEVLLSNSAVQNLIREGKSFQIPSTIQTSKKEGMVTMDDYLYDLYQRNIITQQSAISFAHDQVEMTKRISMSGMY